MAIDPMTRMHLRQEHRIEHQQHRAEFQSNSIRTVVDRALFLHQPDSKWDQTLHEKPRSPAVWIVGSDFINDDSDHGIFPHRIPTDTDKDYVCSLQYEQADDESYPAWLQGINSDYVQPDKHEFGLPPALLEELYHVSLIRPCIIIVPTGPRNLRMQLQELESRLEGREFILTTMFGHGNYGKGIRLASNESAIQRGELRFFKPTDNPKSNSGRLMKDIARLTKKSALLSSREDQQSFDYIREKQNRCLSIRCKLLVVIL